MSDKLKNLMDKRTKIMGERSVLDKRFEECVKEIDEEFNKLSVKLDSLLDECWGITLLMEDELIMIETILLTAELIGKIEEETNLKLFSIGPIDHRYIAGYFKF